jgi:hypothetical protein
MAALHAMRTWSTYWTLLGDYVLAHVGFAIRKVDEEEAARTYKCPADIGHSPEFETPGLEMANDEAKTRSWMNIAATSSPRNSLQRFSKRQILHRR